MINILTRQVAKGLSIVLIVLVNLTTVKAGPDMGWTNKVGARKTPQKKTVFMVNTYGATNDGKTIATAFIQKAIDECASKGGGIVSFKPGAYLTGALFIKSNVLLKIDKGVLLRGSTSFEDYPDIDTRIAGIEMKWPAALINIIGQKNAAVTGDGRIDAQGKFCWDKYWAMRKEYEAKGLRWIVDYDAKRVRTFLVQSSEDITLKGLTFINAGFWTVQLLYSKYLTVDGITIRNNEDGHGPSTDGIDIDSSSWVLVQNSDIDCNDDDFCLKAGRDWDGLRVNRPTEYVVIRKCIARKGGGLLTLGSETSGGIRHVLATDLTALGTGNGFQIKSATTRGGTIEDIHFENVTMDSVGNAFLYTMNWNPSYSYSTLPKGYNYDSIPSHWKTMLHKVEPADKGIPHFKNVYVSNVRVKYARKAFNASGYEKSILQNFNFSKVQVFAADAGEISYAANWKLDEVVVQTKGNDAIVIKNATGVKL
jgi:polygalacturonase